MSMYKTFQTDSKLEQEGIYIDYGSFRVKIARAGGHNLRYTKALEAAVQPYKRMIATNSLEEGIGNAIMHDVYARTLVLNWETRRDNEWVSGIEAEDGSVLPFSPENVILTFQKLPDLFADIQAQAQNQSLYRREIMEGDAKN